MTQSSLRRFGTELASFYYLTILNLCTGAIAIAFVTVSFAINFLPPGPAVRPGIFTVWVAAGVASVLLSIFWITLSAKILNGIQRIWGEYTRRTEPVPDKTLAGWIIGTVTSYRKNRGAIRAMILVCIASGVCLLVFGITGTLESYSISLTSGTMTISSVHIIPPALVALFIALVSLASSWYFAKFSRISDGRQREIERGTEQLERSFGMGKE
ncbi:succinate dehydrogenase hydrophobic anchor subunit [Methanolinea mesophila]|uniref:hypothetical protein n=1 Tax=Methanolinea mesophila TaxID=547055 RepID=UPI001AE57C98|nr:hypothetical protein [Methanolinea mesophila]MBP1927744.1 succinate dehydrogenase hydrophobic anchor subunit [Methanolinea mesophila]